MRTLFLVTARAGSKGVPGKNMKEIGGISLIAWKVREAMQAMGDLDVISISTDSKDMAKHAISLGVDAPFIRPAELATDTAASADVVKHAINFYASTGLHFDRVVLLEPSAPFTRAEDIRTAKEMMNLKNAHLVVGMKNVEPHSTFIAEIPEDNFVTPIVLKMERVGRNLRRQDLNPEWTMNGALYVFDVEMFLRTGSIYGGSRNYGLLMDRWHSIEIDNEDDFKLAEFAFSQGYV